MGGSLIAIPRDYQSWAPQSAGLFTVDVGTGLLVCAFYSVFDVAICLFHLAFGLIHNAFALQSRITSRLADSLLYPSLQFVHFAGHVFFCHRNLLCG
jgi:hypothetical protein